VADDDPPKAAREDEAPEGGERSIEDLSRQLAERIRNSPNRHELTDYAVQVLRDSSEDSDHDELIRDRSGGEQAPKRDPFNPIAFGIPLLVIGAVLSMTGLLTGIGLLVIGVALIMVVYGLLISVLWRGRGRKPERSEGG